jgi:2-hydroxy-3-oxopropionate reductase
VAMIAFIGTGVMGRPMAARLVKAGHDVRCYGHSERARARAAESGAAVYGTVAEACTGAELLITVLPDTSDVHEVVLGDDGAFAHLAAGSCHIDHSTISPEGALAVHAAARQLGIDSLDAPVSGGEAGAIDGNLSIMVGGEAAVFDRALPILRALGTTIVHVGPAGSGQVVKAANQLLVAGNLQFLAEAVVFLRAHSADLPAALDVLAGGLAGSTALTRKRTNLLEETYTPGFRVALHAKDFRIINEAVLSRGLALPATGLVGSLMASLDARGDGGLDHSALLKLALELNGQPQPSPGSPSQ